MQRPDEQDASMAGEVPLWPGQLHKRLRGAARRGETLAALPRWLAVVAAPLEGADRSPAGYALASAILPLYDDGVVARAADLWRKLRA